VHATDQHRERQRGADAYLEAQPAVLDGPGGTIALIRLNGPHGLGRNGVSHAFDGLPHCREAGRAGMDPDGGSLRGEIDIRFVDAVHAAQCALDLGDASGAVHTLDGEVEPGPFGVGHHDSATSEARKGLE